MPDFSNDKILNHDLPRFEEVELTPVSPKYLQVIIVNTIIFSLILLVAGGVGHFFLKSSFPGLAWIVPVVITALVVINFIYQVMAFRQRKYAFRERDVIYQFGLISKTIVIIPFNRIQHTALEEGWLSRSLGLKSVTVFTAGAGGSDLSINGLPGDIAENFNQLILAKIDSENSTVDSLATPESAADVVGEKGSGAIIESSKKDG